MRGLLPQQKINLIQLIDKERIETNITLKEACSKQGISVSSYYQWSREFKTSVNDSEIEKIRSERDEYKRKYEALKDYIIKKIESRLK